MPVSALLRLRLLVGAPVRAASRHLWPVRPLPVVIALVVASLVGASAIGEGLEAAVHTPSRTVEGSAFRPVVVPDADLREDLPSQRPSPSATASPTPTVTPAPTPTPEPVTLIRFRPRDGWTGVSRFADVSVRFSAAMDRVATQAAFLAMIGKTSIAGRFWWAEGDTVLVLNPSDALPYGATVELSVDAGAKSADGGALEAPAAVSFTVQPKPAAPGPAPKPKPSAWQWPLIGPITQYFGQTLTQYGVHQGIDINGETGDAVRAARAGRVIVAGYADECGGLQVRIDHGDGIKTWYRHLSRANVGVGEQVTVGALIGRVGSTGCSTGSHLHFGVQKGSTFVDPLKYLPPR